MFKKIIITTALAAVLPCAAMADSVTAITVSGNQRVDSESVRSYLSFKQGEDFNDSEASESIKRLYSTNLFADISITQQNGVVNVDVIENPIISQVLLLLD